MEEREKHKRTDEQPDVEGHRRKQNDEDARDESKTDDTPDVEAHRKAIRH